MLLSLFYAGGRLLPTLFKRRNGFFSCSRMLPHKRHLIRYAHMIFFFLCLGATLPCQIFSECLSLFFPMCCLSFHSYSRDFLLNADPICPPLACLHFFFFILFGSVEYPPPPFYGHFLPSTDGVVLAFFFLLTFEFSDHPTYLLP